MATQSEVLTLTPGNVSNEKEYAGVKISLENCLFPPEACGDTPSQKDGLGKTAEDDLRRIGCEFIQVAGIMLKVPQVAMASAQVLFQRFFFAKSFVKHKMEEIAMACIWLASKVEECPRRVRDVINVFHYLKLKRNKMQITPMVLDLEYVTLKSNVIKAERRVLKELGFCVHVKHPHKIIVVYLQVLEMEKNRELVQTAWNYMNDSLQTTVFVQYSPETIACACIYLAARVLQIPVPNRPPWIYLFNATEEDIQKICVTLLCVYRTVKTPYEELEKMVDACRVVLQQEKLKARGLAMTNDDSRNPANSPASKPSGSAFDSPQNDEKQQSTHRSSTVPASGNNGVVANGSSKSKKHEIRRSHNSRVKRSRTRSASSNRVKRHRKQSSDYSSSYEGSPPEHDDRKPSHSKDVLPKSYSQQNSNRYPDERRHRRRKHDEKSRHSKHHRRDDRDENKSRDSSRAKRRDETVKKHKRKHSSDASPVAKSSYVNGEKASSASPSKKHHSKSRKDFHKKKPRRSASPSRASKR